MKLNGVIAIEKGVKSRVYARLTELNKLVQKATLFNGLVRTYNPKDEDGETLPPERQIVQVMIKDVLGDVRLNLGEVIDITVQKDVANQQASANVLVDGEEVIPVIPVTSLLTLEKILTDLRTFVGNIPVLDNSEAWTIDVNSGLFRSDATMTQRTKKTQRAIVKYPATEQHPAQTEMITEDVIAGFWTAVRQSGAMPKPVKDTIVANVEKLLIGVKEARERANDIPAPDRDAIGARVFGFLFPPR